MIRSLDPKFLSNYIPIEPLAILKKNEAIFKKINLGTRFDGDSLKDYLIF